MKTDPFIIIIDSLVILFYLLLIALISPYMMRFLKKRSADILVQLIPVLSFIAISCIIISISYGGFQETLFFRLTTILSCVLLFILLLLTLLMKKLWAEQYVKLVSRLSTFYKRKHKILN